MSCENCNSNKIVLISAKCSDMCVIQYDGKERIDYVPTNLGIGGDDYIELDICFDCGKVQGINKVLAEEIQKVFE